MEIGFIGLGRMGLNMVFRLLKKHKVVVWNRTPEKMKIAAKKGAVPSKTMENLVTKLKPIRIIWLMLPAGDITEYAFQKILTMLTLISILRI